MSELFNGTWSIDLDASMVWDDTQRKHVRDEVGQEIITLRNHDGVQDYEVLYGDNPRIRMGYTAQFDDTKWVSYAVREIIAQTGDVNTAIDNFKRRIKASDGERERHFEVGQSYGLVRLVYVDERTHYRISRNPVDNKAQSILLRRMAEDGKSYLTHVLDVHGIIYRIRKFVRV